MPNRRALLGLLLAPPATAQGLSEAQRAEVLDILRRALRDDPSILRDAFRALEEAERADRETARRSALSELGPQLFRDPADPVKGNPRGDVTLVEFFDLRCGFCKRQHGEIEALLRRDGNLRLVRKDLPVLGPASLAASRALLAAQRQGRYHEYHDALMRLRGEPTEAALQAEAQRLGLDWPRLRREMDAPDIARRLERNLDLARRLGIEGTPALLVDPGGAFIPGAVDLAALERIVAEARSRQGG
jgi:protein-disulfide isomerase